MHKIDGGGHVNGQFVSEDPAIGRAPTVVTPEWLNAVQDELAAVIEAAGLTLDKYDPAQLLQALQLHIAAQSGGGGGGDGGSGQYVDWATWNEAWGGHTSSSPENDPHLNIYVRPDDLSLPSDITRTGFHSGEIVPRLYRPVSVGNCAAWQEYKDPDVAT